MLATRKLRRLDQLKHSVWLSTLYFWQTEANTSYFLLQTQFCVLNLQAYEMSIFTSQTSVLVKKRHVRAIRWCKDFPKGTFNVFAAAASSQCEFWHQELDVQHYTLDTESSYPTFCP